MKRHECVTTCYDIPGQMWPAELCWLYDVFSKSKTHVEIGTYCGRSLLASCGGMKKDSVVVSVDNDVDAVRTDVNWVKTIRRATINAFIPLKIRMLESDSMSAALLCHREGMMFDSIFIDACHEYAECSADIEAWMPMLKPGGIIAGHDYWSANPGVMDAVNRIFEDRFSVVPNTRIWFARPITS